MSQKIVSIDRKTAITLQRELEALLTTFASERGLSLEPLRGGFGTNSIRFTAVEFKVGEAEDRAEREKREWDSLCVLVGLESSDYKKRIKIGTKFFTLTKIAYGRSKYPVIAANDNGKMFKFSVDEILFGLGRKSSSNIFDFRTT